ncbi:MAG: PAS domain S-box protein [Desulfobacterales bacterium]
MFEQELNKYWETVVDTIQDGVMIVDSKGTITSVNRDFEAVTGHSTTKILGETLHYIKSQCL